MRWAHRRCAPCWRRRARSRQTRPGSGMLRASSAAEGWTPKLPPTLQAELRDYQLEGFAWLSRLARWGAGAVPGRRHGPGQDGAGAGGAARSRGGGPVPGGGADLGVLNWVDEIARFAPTLTHASSGRGRRPRARSSPGWARATCWCQLRPAAPRRRDCWPARHWQMVVLDEAQAIKNAETKRAQAARGAAGRLPAGADRHAGREPPRRAVEPVPLRQSRPARPREGFRKRFAVPIERDHDAQARRRCAR